MTAAGATRAACTHVCTVHSAGGPPILPSPIGGQRFPSSAVHAYIIRTYTIHTHIRDLPFLQIHLHPPFALAPRFRKSTKEGGLDPTWCRFYGVGGSEDDDGARLGIGTGFVLEGGRRRGRGEEIEKFTHNARRELATRYEIRI